MGNARRHSTRPEKHFLRRAKSSVGRGIRAVAESPFMKFTTGVVLLTSGLDEAIETLFDDISALELGAHHGVMVLGFVNLLSSLPDLLDGMSGAFLVDEDDEDREEPVRAESVRHKAGDVSHESGDQGAGKPVAFSRSSDESKADASRVRQRAA
ncbi:MAG: hypothetical protein ABGW78_02555 [Pirellulales bacterium]